MRLLQTNISVPPAEFLAFRSFPFRSVPFRSVPFRSVPFRSVPFRKLRRNNTWWVDLFCRLRQHRLQAVIVTVQQETENKYLALPYQNLSYLAVLSHVCYMFCPSIFIILIFEDNSSDAAKRTFSPFFRYVLRRSVNTHYQVHWHWL